MSITFPPRARLMAPVVAIASAVVFAALLGIRRTPAPATAAPSWTLSNSPTTRPSSLSQASAEALSEWQGAPVVPVGRNLFALSDVSILANSESESKQAKSPSNPVDAQQQRQGFRDESTRQTIGQIRLQSTMMGPVPRALINGRTVREGDVVASVGNGSADDPRGASADFRVLRIEARRVIVEREGIKLEIPLD